MVLAFKWIPFGDFLFSTISQNEVWKFCLILTWTTSGIERVKSDGQEKSTKILISWQELKNQFISFFVHRYFQGNSEARRTQIIQKWRIDFRDNKNLSSLLIFDGNI